MCVMNTSKKQQSCSPPINTRATLAKYCPVRSTKARVFDDGAQSSLRTTVQHTVCHETDLHGNRLKEDANAQDLNNPSIEIRQSS